VSEWGEGGCVWKKETCRGRLMTQTSEWQMGCWSVCNKGNELGLKIVRGDCGRQRVKLNSVA
jgi:hypothetical protein